MLTVSSFARIILPLAIAALALTACTGHRSFSSVVGESERMRFIALRLAPQEVHYCTWCYNCLEFVNETSLQNQDL